MNDPELASEMMALLGKELKAARQRIRELENERQARIILWRLILCCSSDSKVSWIVRMHLLPTVTLYVSVQRLLNTRWRSSREMLRK